MYYGTSGGSCICCAHVTAWEAEAQPRSEQGTNDITPNTYTPAPHKSAGTACSVSHFPLQTGTVWSPRQEATQPLGWQVAHLVETYEPSGATPHSPHH